MLISNVFGLQEMQERKKIKKKERKKKKKPESEADPDPDPDMDPARAGASEAEAGEHGESSDEAALLAPSPQASAEDVGQHQDQKEAVEAAVATADAVVGKPAVVSCCACKQ